MPPPTAAKLPVEQAPGAPAEVVVDARAAMNEAASGQGVTVTGDELERWAETGEWPASSD